MNKTILLPGVYQYEFPKDLSKKIVKKISKIKNDRWTHAGVGVGEIKHHIRSTLNIDLFQNVPELAEETKKYMVQCVKDYCKEFDIKVSGNEGLNLLRYETNDKYEFHVDDGPGLERKVSCLIYLNPGEYQGGGTTFKHFNYTISPSEPALVLFPSNYPYLHAADPIISGTKYIVVTWISE
jgi:predicted 2-oxoglutarate/Fe(II)-dependent dioxygenase YbiX